MKLIIKTHDAVSNASLLDLFTRCLSEPLSFGSNILSLNADVIAKKELIESGFKALRTGTVDNFIDSLFVFKYVQSLRLNNILPNLTEQWLIENIDKVLKLSTTITKFTSMSTHTGPSSLMCHTAVLAASQNCRDCGRSFVGGRKGSAGEESPS